MSTGATTTNTAPPKPPAAAGGAAAPAQVGPREWKCLCSIVSSLSTPVCRCGRARPKEHDDWPAIFKGMVLHFNGIIPRTLKHPSHSVEWRMAEAHGARVTEHFPERVTHLIYRPGYERSEKVRAALLKHGIRCMPVAWLLDSMLQSRELFENLYKLQQIPAHALPTSSGVMLAHYQHPFYVGNSDAFVIAGYDGGGPESAALLNKKEGEKKDGEGIDPTGFPRFQPVPEIVPRVAASFYPTTGNPVLFSECNFFFTFPGTDGDNREKAIEKHGGKMLPAVDGATFIVYHPDDKKGELMQQAVVYYDTVVAKNDPDVTTPALVTVSWLLDCFFLDEIVPPVGLYTPSDKLMGTLRKKAARAAEKK